MTDLNKSTNYEAEKLQIAKGGLSRILALVKDDDRTWAMISAYRSENSQEENNRQTMFLTSDLAHSHLGAIKMEGGYVEPVADEDVVNDVPTKERCFFVGNITKEQAMELCAKYNQDTVLFRDKDGLRYIDRNGNDKSEIFSTATVDDNYTLEQIKDYFSRRLNCDKFEETFYVGIQNWNWGRHTVSQYDNVEKSEHYTNVDYLYNEL